MASSLEILNRIKERSQSAQQSADTRRGSGQEASGGSSLEILDRIKQRNTGTLDTDWSTPEYSWMKRYNDVLNRVGAYSAQRRDGWTADASGGNMGEIDALLKEYDSFSGDQSAIRKQRDFLSKYREQLTGVTDFFSQFQSQDDYDRQRSGYTNYGVGYTPEGWGLDEASAQKLRKTQAQKDARESQRARAEYESAKKAYRLAQQQYKSLDDGQGGAFTDEEARQAYESFVAAQGRMEEARDAYLKAQNRLDSYNAGWGRVDKYAETAQAAKGTDTGYSGPGYDTLTDWENRRQQEQLQEEARATRTDYVPGEPRYTGETEPQAEDRLGLWRSMTDEQRQAAGSSTNTQLSRTALQAQGGYWDLLTENEVETYYYLRQKEGQQAADGYLDDLYTELARRNDAQTIEGIENASALEKAGMGVLSVGANLVGAIPAAIGTAADLAMDRRNPYSGAQFFQRYASYVRGSIGQDIEDKTTAALADKIGEKFAATVGNYANQTFQALMSGVDSAAGGLIFGQGLEIPAGAIDFHVGGYTTVMGLGAFAQRAQELELQGASRGQIALGSIGSGILEALFEDVSMEAFFKNILEAPAETAKEFVKKMAVQMGVEASEEVCTEVGNMIWDSVVLGQNADNSRAIRAYMDQGMSREEARHQAMKDAVSDIYWAGFGGAVSAGAMAVGGQALAGTGRAIDTARSNYQVGSYLLENGSAAGLVDQAESLTDTRAHDRLVRLAKEVADNQSHGDSSYMNRYTTGRTANQIAAQAQREGAAAKKSSFQAVAAEYLKGQNISNPERTGKLLTKAYLGEYMTPLQKALYASAGGEKLLSAVVDSVPKGSIESDTQARLQNSQRTILGTYGAVTGSKSVTAFSQDFASRNDGQTFRVDTQEPVNIRGIARMTGDGKMLLRTDDGGEVDAAQVSYGTYGQAKLFRVLSAMEISTDTANQLLGMVEDTPLSVKTYAEALQSAYLKGYTGVEFDRINRSSYASQLTEAQRRIAWEAGKAARAARVGAQAKTVDTGAMRTARGGLKIGENVDMANLNPAQESAVTFLRTLAESGVPVEIYASTEEERAKGTPNGSFSPDGTVRLDINAGDNGQGAVAYALAHEITHFTESYSPEKFQALADILIREAGEKGISWENMLEGKTAELARQEQYRDMAENRLSDLARSECIAEMCETMLSDTDAAARVSRQLQAQDKSLWGRIKGFFRGLVEKLKKAYKDMDPDSAIAREMKGVITDSEAIANAWADAVSDSVGNFQLQEGQKKNAQEGVRFSLRGQTQREITARYQAEVDGILNMQDTASKQVIVGYTPSVYQKLGMPSLPLTIGSGHVYSAAKTEAEARQDGNFHKGVHYHGLGDAAVKNIYHAVQDPVMIIASKDVNKNASPMRSTHSVVAIVDIGTAEKSLLIPIEITAERTVNGVQMDVNTISSVYEKSVKGLVTEAIALENSGEIGVFYAKKEALTLPVAGVQFPVRLQQSIASNNIVHRFSEKVNMKISESTQSQQFKRWFGDWQNDPASASKVVNADGTPKVVYHGTNAEFTVFDLSKSGRNYGETSEGLFFFTNKKSGYQDSALDYAEAAAQNGGKATVGEYYLDIKNPLRLYSDGYFTPTAYFDQNAQDIYEKYLSGDNYDGIIIESRNKSADDSIIYLLDNPNQIKSATDNIGTFDKGNPDIRYSQRTREGTQVDRLAKQNEILGQEVKYLKQLVDIQKRGNKDHILDRNSVNQQGRILMEGVNAKGSAGEFNRMLNDFYREISTVEMDYDTLKEKAGVLADWLLDHHQAEKDSYAQEILDFLAKRRVSLNEGQTGDIEYGYGSLNDFKKAIKGSVILDQNATTSLGQLWQEAAERFPDRFQADTVDADMPDGLASVVEWANSSESAGEAQWQYYRAENRNDLIEQVLLGYWEAKPIQSVADKSRAEIAKLRQEHREAMQKARKEKRQAVTDERARSNAAIEAYRAQRDIVDTVMMKVYSEQRNQVEQAYASEMKRLRKSYSEDTKLYQEEFFRIMKDKSFQEAHVPSLRKMLNEMAKANSDGNKDAEQARRQVYASLREQYEQGKNIQELEAKVKKQREAAKAKVESRRQTELRGKIQRTAGELNRYLLHPTNTVHVPAAMQRSVAHALDALNDAVSDRKTAINADRLSKYADQLRELQKDAIGNAAEIREVQRKLQTLTERDTRFRTAMGELKEQYQALVKSADPEAAQIYDENVAGWIQDCIDTVKDTEFRDMNSQQLESVQKAYRALLRRIQVANQAFQAGKQSTIREKVGRFQSEMALRERKEKIGGRTAKAVGQFFWNNLKPVYAFGRIGSAVFSELYENLRGGEDTWAVDVSDARAYFMGTAAKYRYNTWDFDSLTEYTAASGQKFSLNLEERMSLYAYSLRQQARDHLLQGGIVLNENTERTVTDRLGMKRTKVYNDANAYNLTDETISAIADSLTPEQRAFAREMQQYLSTVMGAKGNEVSRAMYDIDLFKEQFYWPLKSSKDYSARIKDAQDAGNKIKNWGAAKPTTPGANNPVVLSGFMETWAGHINEMSMYHAFTLPMEDFYRVYNWNSGFSEEGTQSKSTVQTLKDIYGDGATNYIDQFLKDLNGGLRADPRATVGRAMLSQFKKAAVFASASVAIQQPSAVGRAFSIIDPKYFVGGKVENAGESWEQCKKYSSVAIIKEMGRFDMDMGRSTVDYITAKEYTGFREKAGAFFQDAGFRDEIIGKAPEMADQITWCAMWEAAKRQTAARHPGLKGEALLAQAGKLFTECITRTQVYDSVFSRSANMRSKDTGMAMATSFMAEPTTSINMIENALRQWGRGDKRGASKAVAGVLTSVIINSALVSFVYAARNRDEDKTYWEKYLASLTGELMEGVNPVTYVPYAQDVWSMLQGYDLERSDMSLAADAVNALNKIARTASKYPKDGTEAEQQAWLKDMLSASMAGVDGVASIFGIPEKNIRRDVVAVMNLFQAPNWGESDSGTVKDAIREAVKDSVPIWNQLPNDSQEDKLYKAVIGGTPAQLHRLQAKYKTAKELESAMVSALRTNDPRIHQAAQARVDGDDATRLRLSKEIIGEKHFTQNQVVVAINNEVSRIEAQNREKEDRIKEQSLYYVEDYIDAAAAGVGSAEPIRQEIERAKIANSDKSPEEAKQSAGKSFEAAVKSAAKEQFLDGELTMEQTERVLTAAGAYDGDAEDIHRNVYAWQIAEELGGSYDWNPGQYVNYWETIRPTGITADLYDDYLGTVSAIRGIDYDGDGKNDAYSAIDQVLAYIDSLPISDDQKDLLFALKYPTASKKTLQRRPWIKGR